MKFTLIALVVLLGAAAAATYIRYQSYDPCRWMAQDLQRGAHISVAVAEARIRAAFLLDGIVDPTPIDCLQAWWRFRADAMPGEF